MYIISKFQDYYDSVIGMTGIDKKTVFNRTQEIINVQNNKNFERVRHSIRMNSHYSFEKKSQVKNPIPSLEYKLYIVNKVYTGFCFFSDSLIPKELADKYSSRRVLIETSFQKRYSNVEVVDHGYLFFNPLEIEDFLTNIGYPEKAVKAYIKTPEIISSELAKTIGSPVFMTANFLLKNQFFRFVDKEVLQTYKELESRDPDYDIENIIVTNPILSQLGIPSMIEAFNVFQDISMYIADVSNIEVDSYMTDLEKRDAKGFDNYSFKHRK